MSFILGLLGACLGIILAVAIIIGIILISLNKHLGAGSLKQILHAARNAKDIRKQEYSRIKNVSGMTKLMEPLILREKILKMYLYTALWMVEIHHQLQAKDILQN